MMYEAKYKASDKHRADNYDDNEQQWELKRELRNYKQVDWYKQIWSDLQIDIELDNIIWKERNMSWSPDELWTAL